MNRQVFDFLFFLIILPFCARAQPPEISFSGPGTTWVVKISRTEPEKHGKDKTETPAAQGEAITQKSPQDKSVNPEQLEIKSGTNNVIIGTITSNDGSKEIFYIADSYLLQKASNSDQILTIPVSTSEKDPMSLKVSKFPGLAWVSQSNYRGDVKKEDVLYKHFTHQEFYGGADMPPTNLEAMVRKTDGHPMTCNINNEIFFTYGEVSPFPEPVALPDKFKAALAKRDREKKALEAIRRANEQQPGAKK